MLSLPNPDYSSMRADFDRIFIDGDGTPTLSDAWKDFLEAFCAEYTYHRGRPADDFMGNEVPNEIKETVLSAYGEIQDRGKLSAMRAMIKLLARECPYCGFGPIEDLDHHLPKGVYKLLSIFALNLVPCCATCNRKKKRKPASDPTLQWVHAYLDAIDTYKTLSATVDIDLATKKFDVCFSFIKQPGMSDEYFSRLNNHMDEFGLRQRFPKQVNLYLTSLEAPLEMLFAEKGANGVRELLANTEKVAHRAFGLNNWRRALAEALGTSDEFCEGGYRIALGK